MSAPRQEVEPESGTFNLAWVDKAFEEFDRTIEDSTLQPPSPDEEKEEHPHSVEQAQVAMEEDKTTTPNTHAGISVCVQIEAMPAILDDFGLVTGEIVANENRPNFGRAIIADTHTPKDEAHQQVCKTGNYETSTTPHDLYEAGHTLPMSRKVYVKPHEGSMHDERDMMQTNVENKMTNNEDVFMVISQTNDNEHGRYVTHMSHDMTQTRSMTNTMGGGDVVAETDNSKYTSCVTENECSVGLCKQPHTQTSIDKCCGECKEDKHTLRSELHNAIHTKSQHTHHEEVWTKCVVQTSTSHCKGLRCQQMAMM